MWSRRQPFACVGAVLSLLDDPAFCVVWFRFRLLRRYLDRWPTQVGRVYRLLEMASEGSPGHGPVHLLSASAAATKVAADLCGREVSGVDLCWMFLAPCSFLILLMFVRGTRLC